MVRTGTKTPEEVSRAEEVPLAEACNGCGNTMIIKFAFEGKMKDCPISKLLITKTGHKPTQFTNTLLVLCAYKNFRGLNEVLGTGIDLVESNFMPTYPNTNQWSTSHHMQISIVNSTDPEAPNGSRPERFGMMERTHIFDANRQKELLSEYK